VSTKSTGTSAQNTGTFLEHHSWVDLAALREFLLRLVLHVRCSEIGDVMYLLTHHGLDGGTESLGITAGETTNPSRNMPRVVKFVFWRYVNHCHCIPID
jgi:hypothetical protein